MVHDPQMVSFRKVVSTEDIVAVARLAREIWVEHYVPIIGRAQVDYMLDKFQSPAAIRGQITAGYEYYLIEAGCALAGYFAIVRDPDDPAVMLLSKLYVAAEFRRRGLATAALALVEAQARKQDIRAIRLTVNKNNAGSIAWYEQAGFRNRAAVTKDIGGGFVMDDYVMEKDT